MNTGARFRSRSSEELVTGVATSGEGANVRGWRLRDCEEVPVNGFVSGPRLPEELANGVAIFGKGANVRAWRVRGCEEVAVEVFILVSQSSCSFPDEGAVFGLRFSAKNEVEGAVLGSTSSAGVADEGAMLRSPVFAGEEIDLAVFASMFLDEFADEVVGSGFVCSGADAIEAVIFK